MVKGKGRVNISVIVAQIRVARRKNAGCHLFGILPAASISPLGFGSFFNDYRSRYKKE